MIHRPLRTWLGGSLLAAAGGCAAGPVDEGPAGDSDVVDATDVPVVELVPPPGVPAVAVRRLTRAELEASLEALFGVEVELSKRLPDDDLVDGFDNQAAALTVPELLVEGLDAVALELAAEVVARVHRPAPIQRVELEDLSPATGTAFELPSAEGTWWLWWGPAPRVQTTFTVAEEGEYVIRVPAFSTWGPGVPQGVLDLMVDGVSLGRQAAIALQEAPDLVRWPVRLDPGDHTVSVRLTNGSPSADLGEAGVGVAVGRSEVSVGLDAIELRGPLAEDEGRPTALRAQWVPCDPDDPREQVQCAETVLTALARRAWRRPVTNPEVQALVRFVEEAQATGASWDDGLATAIHAVLLSPHFLFRVERGTGRVVEGGRSLTDHELATRLSYFLWSAPPDPVLAACADEGTLLADDGPCGLPQQVERMVADGRTLAMVERFARPWLDLADPDLAEPATDDFLAAWLLDDAPVSSLLDGQGLDAEVVDATRPGGALALPEWLTSTSSDGRTSVVKRGVLIAARLLCDPPEGPPPKVPMLEPGNNALAALDAHRSDPACSGCHQGFDPYGEVLEVYDAVGAPRTRYADGQAVPTQAELPDGSVVEGVAGLVDWLTANQDFHRCVTAQVARYGWGVSLEDSTELLAELEASTAAAGGSTTDLLRSVALHPAFRRLTMEDAP